MKVFRRAWPYLLLVILLLANVVVWSERQAIVDWWRLREYRAPNSISSLANEATMTDDAKHLFYVNHPSLESKESFNEHCADESKETAVLGCYRGNRQGIYIYDVNDERLNGVKQVTAAHEMLHQAYDRLSDKDRQHIDQLLENFYKNGLNDEAVKTKLDSYKKQSGTVLANEMHSIFGTEVRDLPAELETYYRKYFTDRSKVVSYREAYQGEFTRRQDLVKQYDGQLGDLKKQINTNKATLEQEMGFLNEKEKSINQDINASNQSAYQADVQSYNTTVNSYNTLLTTTRSLISQYNDIVNKRNDLAIQEQQLQQALDSRLNAPTTKQ
jgi:hypothetical protein